MDNTPDINNDKQQTAILYTRLQLDCLSEIATCKEKDAKRKAELQKKLLELMKQEQKFASGL